MAVRKINIDESEISVIFGLHDDDYICLTDMVKAVIVRGFAETRRAV